MMKVQKNTSKLRNAATRVKARHKCLSTLWTSLSLASLGGYSQQPVPQCLTAMAQSSLQLGVMGKVAPLCPCL